MVRLPYRFHAYYHIRRNLKRLQVPLLHEAGDNSYSSKGFFKICEDYEVPHEPMKYKDEKFCWTYQ